MGMFIDDRIFKKKFKENLIFKNFENPPLFCKIREIFCLFLFYNVHKESMFTIEIEDGREAP